MSIQQDVPPHAQDKGNELWVTSWSQAVTDISAAGLSASDATIRITVTSGVTGTQLQLNLSNRFGARPVTIGRASVRVGMAVIRVLFEGRPSVSIAAGGELVSDTIAAEVTAGSTLVVDLFLPGTQGLATGNLSVSSWMRAAGDHCGADELPAGETLSMPHPLGGTIPAPTPLLRGVDVGVASPMPVVVCLGDSITAAGWPERASELLRADRVSIVNRGIAGNRLRLPGAGPMGGFFGEAGAARWEADVLDTAGRTHVLVALGTNDLGHPGTIAPESELPTVAELTRALDDVASRARSAGLTVILATITPFLPAAGYDAAREDIRRGVNEWIRQQSGVPVVDFDSALRDHSSLSHLASVYDGGDHLHPSSEGLDRMAEEAASVILAISRRG